MHVHAGWQGGKFSATPNQKKEGLQQIAAVAHVGAESEAVGLHLLPHWHGTGDETKVFWDDATYKHLLSDTRPIPTVRWKRGTKWMDHVPVTCTGLEHRLHDFRLLMAAVHMPAHLFLPNAEQANVMAFKGLRYALGPIQQEFNPDAFILFMDANREVRLDRNRRLVNHSVEDLGLRLHVPPHGTHGPRKIDFGCSNLEDVWCLMLNKVPKHDHTGLALGGRIPE